MNIVWHKPLWLLLLSYPLLLMLWHYYRQRKQVQQYTDAALLPWVQAENKYGRRSTRTLLWIVFWWLTAIALADPRIPIQQSNTPVKPDKTIMLVVDVSRSMHATDITPSRLQRATLELYELLAMTNASRIGIIVYAARPHLLVPATGDSNAVKFYTEKLDTLILPTLGSDPSAALQYAQQQLQLDHTPETTLPQSIIWLTDGDITPKQETALKQQIQQLQQANIPLYILGIGTEDGAAIPLPSTDKITQQWLEYKGQIVRSRLNSTLLQQLSTLGNGRYSSVKNDATDWQYLYQDGIAKTSTNNMQYDEQQQWRMLYHWALLPALLLLFALLTLPRRWLAIMVWFIPFMAVLPLTTIQTAYADTDTALSSGINAYRNQDYPQAISHFSNAVFNANTDQQRARALHNLGNSYFQYGNYQAAIQVFRDALTYRPNHQPTLNNLQLGTQVQAELERQLAAKKSAQDNGSDEGANRFERLHNVLDSDQESSPTWGESQSKLTTLGLPAFNLDKATLDQLVNNGLQRLAENGVNNMSELSAWQQRQQSQHEARIALQKMDDNPASFWKRLFEIEEGFPASLDKPKEIPEVLPW